MKATQPGRVLPVMEPDVVAMFCTAGHVDHGKTLLVQALTGCATDRLKEEIERGLTIELGFAPCWLGDGLCAGVVDVPGHERFVRTMVAGVSGMDFCVLVVAADDGIMPQTREHVEILQLLGMTRGLVALTKTDLVSPGRVTERLGELRAFLAPTFLREAPIFPVSSVTGEGFGEFYDGLVAGLKSALRDRGGGLFRMPVSRAFLRPGFGAVVTGIPLAGRISIGDAVECVPGGRPGRVRGLQRFGRNAPDGLAGQCLALNVPEFAKELPVRGQALCLPGSLRPARLFHARIRSVSALDPPLRNAEPVFFHSGTAEAAGRVYLLDTPRLEGGAETLAVVRVSDPVPAVEGDPFILRRVSPPMTVCGGRVLRRDERDRRPRRREAAEELRRRESALQDVAWDSPEGRARRAEYLLIHGEPVAWTTTALARELQVNEAEARAAITRLVSSGAAVDLGDGSVAQPRRIGELTEKMERRLSELACAANRLRVPLGEWRREFDVPDSLWARCCAELERSGPVRISGGYALPAGAVDALPESDRALAERMMDRLEREGFQTTHPDELSAALGAPGPTGGRILEYLCARGDLVRIAPNVVLTAKRLREAQDAVVRAIREKGSLDSPAFRDSLGVSRKYAMAILDYLDSRKVTIRSQNLRRLLPGWENRLV